MTNHLLTLIKKNIKYYDMASIFILYEVKTDKKILIQLQRNSSDSEYLESVLFNPLVHINGVF